MKVYLIQMDDIIWGVYSNKNVAKCKAFDFFGPEDCRGNPHDFDFIVYAKELDSDADFEAFKDISWINRSSHGS